MDSLKNTKSFIVSPDTFYTSVSVFFAITFWFIQIFSSSSFVDLFNFSLILIGSLLFIVDKKNILFLAVICGYLTASTQGLTFESGIKDGQIFTGTITSLVLSILLLIKIGKFSKNKINLLIIVLSLPFLFAIISYLLDDHYFIYSEAKKFIFFFVFLTVALTCHHNQEQLLFKFVVYSIFFVTILSILAYFMFNVSYSYSGINYPIIPISVAIIPLIYIFNKNSLFLKYSLFIVFLFIFGLIQPSAKIIILISFVLVISLAKLKFSGITFVLLFVGLLGFGLLDFDNNMRHKVLTLSSSWDVAINLILSGSVEDSFIFFRTSVGNIMAEFITVIRFLFDSFFLPPGVGYVIPDIFGWLSMSNDASYDIASHADAKYPLHLGIYYLLLWYGPFLIFSYHYFKNIKFFMVSFILFSLSTPSLILLSSLLINHGEIKKNETN